jgi:hypothetical protein
VRDSVIAIVFPKTKDDERFDIAQQPEQVELDAQPADD